MFELFKNTGIQYFGQSAKGIDFSSLRNKDYGDNWSMDDSNDIGEESKTFDDKTLNYIST